MSFSDSNRTGLSFIAETVWGTRPTGPVMAELNFTSESLKGNVDTVTSNTIRSDRNVPDITVVGGGAGGDISFEMRYNDFEELLAGALNADWVSTIASAGIASTARFSGGNIHANGSALNSLKSGMFIRIKNATTSGNNGDYQISTAVVTGASALVTMLEASSGSTASFTSEVFAAATTLKGRNLRNGIVKKSYSIEKSFADVSTYSEYTGMRVGSLSLDLSTQSILTGAMTFTGKSEAVTSTSVASATTAATTNLVMNASDNVARVWEGSQALTTAVFQALTLELNNNTRDQPQIGSNDLAGIGLGRCEITGGLTAYFENDTLVSKFVDNTATNLRFQVTDGSGNSYIISLPNVRYTDSTVAAGGVNSDILQELSWGAIVDSTGTYAISIDALDA